MISDQSARRIRAFRRAASAWNQGKPHRAWEIIATAGLDDPDGAWRAFRTEACRRARRVFQVRLAAGR